ncbi:MAG: BatA domain-containing protein [Kiritimatiellae bacterium]|nr:BatA domain-containing protein [Kiritimatiellia bacterium]
MGLIFANPAAAWMLLGLPAVLAVHFLQSRNRPREISTLFLLAHLPEESKRGAVFTFLRNSLQLWMQLLSVLLLALLLAQPRWTRTESVQSIAVVLDDTAHMTAFREEALTALRAELRRLARSAARSEWLITPGDSAMPPLYRGESLTEALAALDTWRPALLQHDPAPALHRARERVGPDGLLLWVTAHPPDAAPAGAQILGVGRPLDNSGFTGVRVQPLPDGRLEWTASIIHFGNTPAERELRVEVPEGGTSPPQRITLAPEALTTLRGTLPAGSQRGILRLNPDAYGLDDVFPFLQPKPKTLRVRIPAREQWGQRVLDLLPHLIPGEPADFHWERIGEDGPPPGQSGLFVYAGENEGQFGQILAEDHPLVRDLNWNGFLGRPMAGFTLLPGDQPLVWMGEHPLIVLRESGNTRQLIFAFNPDRGGNAERLPAVILTAHRFVERVREQQPGFEALALETHQRIRLALPGNDDLRLRFTPVDGLSREWTAPAASRLSAPDEPGFLEIFQNDLRLLEASVAMADTSIADLRGAAPRPLPDNLLAELQQRNSRRDAFTPLWFALFGLTLFVGWLKPQ